MRHFITIVLMLIFLRSQVKCQQFVCDTNSIINSFYANGYIRIDVENSPCGLYFLDTFSKKPLVADSLAKTLGGSLISFADSVENKIVRNAVDSLLFDLGFMLPTTLWIGYKRVESGEADFYPLDGSMASFTPSPNNTVYQNWAIGEPNNNGYLSCFGSCGNMNCSNVYRCENGEQCVQIYTTGKWNDLPCNGSGFALVKVNLCFQQANGNGLLFEVNDTTVCKDFVLHIGANIYSNPFYSYQWLPSGDTTPITLITVATDTMLYLNVTSKISDCYVRDSLRITAAKVAARTFFVDSAVCLNQLLDVVYTDTLYPNTIYNWDFDNAVVLSGSNHGPYSVKWMDSSSIKTVKLSINKNGCLSQQTVRDVTVLALPKFMPYVISDSICKSTQSGIIDLSATANSNPSLKFSWLHTSDSAFVLQGLSTGVYTVGILDTNNCLNSNDFRIANFKPVLNNVFVSADNGSCSGVLKILDIAGRLPISILWGDSSTLFERNGLCAATYEYQLTDSIGCVTKRTATVSLASSIAVTEINESLRIYPNPFSNFISLHLSRIESNIIYFNIFDMAGRIICEKKIELINNEAVVHFAENELQSGMYFIHVYTTGISYRTKIFKE